MKPLFYIQPGHIHVQHVSLNIDCAFRDVFPKLFSENSESAYIFWKEIPIRFHYTFECFANLDRLIVLMNKIIDNKQGTEQFTFLTDTLVGNWTLDWSKDSLSIQSNWIGNQGFSEYADALNRAGSISMPIDAFIAEWKLLLVQVLNSLDTVSAAKLNENIQETVQFIGKILKSTEKIGTIYTKNR